MCKFMISAILLTCPRIHSLYNDFDDEFDYLDGDFEEMPNFQTKEVDGYLARGIAKSNFKDLSDPSLPDISTECATATPLEMTGAIEEAATTTPLPESISSSTYSTDDNEQKTKDLRNLVQHLYVAQARVQLEATEIKKAQAVANSAQQELEDAANHVRTITAALQNSQQEVASAAIRAQTAQLQLAAHDQLLFAARQDVDALSSQMVGLQAAEGISQPKITVDLTGLLEKLKQPLQESERPTAIPPIVAMPTTQKPKDRFYSTIQQQIQQIQAAQVPPIPPHMPQMPQIPQIQHLSRKPSLLRSASGDYPHSHCRNL